MSARRSHLLVFVYLLRFQGWASIVAWFIFLYLCKIWSTSLHH